MKIDSLNKIKKIPNLMLIAGNGRNVGKTTLACKIISFFANSTDVIGLKISPHFHEQNNSEVVFSNEKIRILKETQINSKDSSLMLQAGAKLVYFVMVKPEHLNESINHLIEILPNNLIICESGGLIEYINPGLFLMVKRKEDKIIKTHFLRYSPVITNNNGEQFDFDIQQLEFKDHHIGIENSNGKI